MRMKELRHQINKSQKEVAEELGIARTKYARYEVGESNPDIDVLVKIADYFNVSLDYLCGRPNSNLIFTESLTESQRKLVNLIKMLTPDQTLIALGYFSEMLKIPYAEVRPIKPF